MEFQIVSIWIVSLCLPLLASVSGEGNVSSSNASCPVQMPINYQPPEIIPTSDVADARFDCVILVTDSLDRLSGDLESLKTPLENYAKVDSAHSTQTVLVQTDSVPSGRLIFSPTGPLNRDYDDVRRFADAAKMGMARALAAGSKKPLLVRPPGGPFDTATVAAVLGALETLYVPLELREAGQSPKVDALGAWSNDADEDGLDTVRQLEIGRIVGRDIAGTDPERMAPPGVEAYVREVFKDSGVEMAVIDDVETLKKDYPLLSAVNRAASAVKRHNGRLIYLSYQGSGPITQTLFIVGKGITFDTGGANVKTGGIMVGMSRDKSGAGAVAGFMKVLSLLKPKYLNVVGAMPMVRNNIGEESYVVDEVITSRAGVRVRVDNTDAEGRMVMADVLCRMKEMALQAVNPHLMTIATLTGHAITTVGKAYTVVMDNGPARAENSSQSIQAAGEKYGEPFEISVIRREDYENHKGQSQYENIKQMGINSHRGHQGPAAFLIMASGLDKHGIDSKRPLAYTHMDIAGSARISLKDTPSAAPVIGLAGRYVLGAMG